MIRSERMHAFRALLRVARVGEVRATQAWAEAFAEEQSCADVHEELSRARDAVLQASHGQVAHNQYLDMARYEMLSRLDEVLVDELHTASDALNASRKESVERATVAIAQKRQRENIQEKVRKTGRWLNEKQTSAQQEEAIETWHGAKKS